MKHDISSEHRQYLRRGKQKTVLVNAARLGLLALLLGLWELVTALGWADPFLLSSPSRIVKTIASLYTEGTLFYHIGVTLLQNPDATEEQLHVRQWQPYEMEGEAPTAVEALTAVRDYLDRHGMEALHTSTQIIIAPGYDYRIVRAMVTNFHQPQSTLLLLVSAFVHGDWHTIYDYAIAHDFRFLSYGDSSLLIP